MSLCGMNNTNLKENRDPNVFFLRAQILKTLVYPIWIRNVNIISTHLVSRAQVIHSSVLITCDVSHDTHYVKIN